MGYGDEIMGSGMARGMAAKGKRMAFGDGHSIMLTRQAYEIYENNPNIARPGQENDKHIVWCKHYQGHRLYHAGFDSERFFYNPEFKAIPGEIFFSETELKFGREADSNFVLIEPNVKPVARNKQWGFGKYAKVANALMAKGYKVRQLDYGQPLLSIPTIRTPSFRHALAVMRHARLYIGPEGGLHHGAAAVGTPAVVIFGGYVHPGTTGYASHTNLFAGDAACGSRSPCKHCVEAMEKITVNQVVHEARVRLVLPR